jgi:integrase
MSRKPTRYTVGEFWLDKRRDGKAPDIWQIASYKPASRSVVYRSTHERSLEQAKAKIDAHHAEQKALGKQQPEEAQVVPLLLAYWHEKGKDSINSVQVGVSIRQFVGFLLQDQAGPGAVVTDLTPTFFERFRVWRMGPHVYDVPWQGKHYRHSSPGVVGATVGRAINDVRAAIGHAAANGRLPFAPKIRSLDSRYKSKPRDRVLTDDELARILWYAKHSPEMFRFVTLQLATGVRPMAAAKFDPRTQFKAATGLIDLQPAAAPQTKKRNAVIPAIRPLRLVLKRWAEEGSNPVETHKRAWRTMRRTLDLSPDVHAKTIRHTVATMLYSDGSVPTRQISDMLGHTGELAETSKRYAHYNPQHMLEVTRALTTIWLQVRRNARQYGADHLLTTTGQGGKITIMRKNENV